MVLVVFVQHSCLTDDCGPSFRRFACILFLLRGNVNEMFFFSAHSVLVPRCMKVVLGALWTRNCGYILRALLRIR